MNQVYKYTLDSTSRKFVCPSCGKQRFVRYVNTATMQYEPPQYGRCDREANCAYHLAPPTDKNNIIMKPNRIEKQDREKHLQTIPADVLAKTLAGYEHNVFIQNLLNNIKYNFNLANIEQIIELYYLGTISKGDYKGAITFPFIDKDKNIRAIQVKQFDRANHTTATNFLHSILTKTYAKMNKPLPAWLAKYNDNEIKVSCLFGEHLLSKYPLNPVALVEAPKTAIYGALYFGHPIIPSSYVWLGVYNLSSLNYEKCKALAGRNVVLFPDLSENGAAYNRWKTKADELAKRMPGTNFTVSDLLERKASNPERQKGCDLADYLINKDWFWFRRDVIPNYEHFLNN